MAVHYEEPFFEQAPHRNLAVRRRRPVCRHLTGAGTQTCLGRRPALSERGSATDKAKVVLIEAGGAAPPQTPPRLRPGTRQRPARGGDRPEEAWMVDLGGLAVPLHQRHVLARRHRPSWASTITVRPNESIEQFVPDTPPPDDSELFAPPPVPVETKASGIPSPR